MNNNIKDTTSLVFVKGRNLIDSSKIMFGSVASGTGVYSYYSYSAVTDYIPVETGVYYLKLFNPGSGNNAVSVFRITGYDSNKNYLWDDTNLDITERMITATSTKYIRICFKKGNYQTISSLQDIISSNPQLVAGSQATTYEAYVIKRILLKNKDNVFEEFYSENELNQDKYSLGEQRIGTWIDGKPLYRKTIKIENTALAAGDNNIAHGISNLKQCIKAELSKNGSHIFPYFNYNSNNQILSMTFISHVSSTDITIRLMNDNWGSGNVWYVTLYYTKTTD